MQPARRIGIKLAAGVAADYALDADIGPGLEGNFVAGIGVTASAGLPGAEYAIGMYYNTRTGDWGFFQSPGVAMGLNTGGDVFIGWIDGPSSNVYGRTFNNNFAGGPISITTLQDLNTLGSLGYTVGIGWSVTPYGYSTAIDNTVCVTSACKH
jgi:hypothetical protein